VKQLGPAVLLPTLVAELSLACWMLFKGIDTGKWYDKPSAQQTR